MNSRDPKNEEIIKQYCKGQKRPFSTDVGFFATAAIASGIVGGEPIAPIILGAAAYASHLRAEQTYEQCLREETIKLEIVNGLGR